MVRGGGRDAIRVEGNWQKKGGQKKGGGEFGTARRGDAGVGLVW